MRKRLYLLPLIIIILLMSAYIYYTVHSVRQTRDFRLQILHDSADDFCQQLNNEYQILEYELKYSYLNFNLSEIFTENRDAESELADIKAFLLEKSDLLKQMTIRDRLGKAIRFWKSGDNEISYNIRQGIAASLTDTVKIVANSRLDSIIFKVPVWAGDERSYELIYELDLREYLEASLLSFHSQQSDYRWLLASSGEILAANDKAKKVTIDALTDLGDDLGQRGVQTVQHSIIYDNKKVKLFSVFQPVSLAGENFVAIFSAYNREIVPLSVSLSGSAGLLTFFALILVVVLLVYLVFPQKEKESKLLAATQRFEEKEALLKRSEQRFKQLVENGIVGIAIIQKDGVIEYANPHFAMTFETSPNNIKDVSIFSYAPNETEKNRWQQEHQELFDGDIQLLKEEKAKGRSGGDLTILQDDSLIEDIDGEFKRVCVVMDITQRKAIEEALNHEKSLLTALINSVPDLIFYKNKSGYYLGCNRAFEKFTGLTFFEIHKRNDEDIFVGQPEMQKLLDLREALEKNSLLRSGMWVQKDHQKAIFLETIKTPFTNQQGEIIGLIGISRDLSNQKNDEIALQEAKEKAESATKAKSMFLANMSHEIRTPMNGIIGMTNILSDTDLMAEQREYVKTIQIASSTLLTIVNDILDFSKIEANQIELECIPFDFRQTLLDIQKVFKLRTDEKGLKLTIDISPDLPQMVNGDPVRLQQIFNNLLSNAVKFTEKGEISVICRKLAEDEKFTKIEVQVRDTGIGISESARKRLFKTFSQADPSTTRKYGGSGLGLVITQGLVKLMHGEIFVTSQSGKGTEFVFTLQLRKAANEIAAISAADIPQKEKQRDLRILLAEDNIINRQVAILSLKKFGFKADTVENGQEALEKVISKEYDIILMDVQMPVMDGITATQKIREFEKAENRRPIRIIAMTANAMREDKERCLAAGMDDYISKPFKPAELLKLIND
jgi:PAS domain S-box-containing protein